MKHNRGSKKGQLFSVDVKSGQNSICCMFAMNDTLKWRRSN